ncbi:MAG: hypothetical protein ACN0LA_08165 [Candidatus Longimicrobiales bacterium M2_2A_002]
MFVAELLFALVIALIIVAIFSYGFRRPGPWGGFLWFFLLVFLGGWAIAAWAEPVGPVAWGVAWMPIFFAALLIALIVAAIPPIEPRPAEPVEQPAPATGVGVFFWFLLLFLIVIGGLAAAY